MRRWPGRGEDAVVLLHGLLDSSEGWNGLCKRLSGARIAFDLPGFGYSDPPQRGSIAGYARDIAEGLELLGVNRMILVGHSLGGAVAAELAEMLPQRVTALVLLAPAGFGRLVLAQAALIPGASKLMQVALPVLLSSRLVVTAVYVTMVTNGKCPEPGLVERVTSRGPALVNGVREGARSLAKAGTAPRRRKRRRIAYDGPVHAVWGERDRLVPLSHRQGVRAAFPQTHIHVWKGMGHHPARERADALVAVVQQALAEGRGRRRQANVSFRDAA